MADEISITCTILVNKGEVANRGIAASGKKFTQSGDGYASATVDLTAGAWTALDVSDLTVPGHFQLVNAKTSGVIRLAVEVSSGVYAEFARLQPKQPGSGYWVSQIYARMVTGTGRIEYFVAEA